MEATEKSAFDRELFLDPFLAEAVEGYRSDPQALFDLPVYKVNSHVWWALAGMGTVLFVFLFLSQWVDNIPARKLPITPQHISAPSIVEKPQPMIFESIQSSKRVPKIKALKQESSHEMSSLKKDFVLLEYVPVLEISGIENETVLPEIHLPSSGTYILGLKVAKPLSKPSNKWRFEYGKSSQNVPAQFENEESFYFNKQIISRYSKIENPTYEDSLRLALAAFKKNDFKACLAALKKIEASDPIDLNVLFYSGLSHFHLGEYSKAIDCFSSVSTTVNAIFAPEAKWYLAQSLWKSGQKADAQKLFSEIISEGGFYAKRAVKLRNDGLK